MRPIWCLCAVLLWLPVDGDEARKLNEQGVAHLKERRYAEAVRAFEEALKLDPEEPVLRRNLATALTEEAVALLNAGKPAEAESRARRARSLREDDARAAEALGSALSRLDRLEEAEAELSRASRLDPGNPAVLEALGSVRERREDLAGAVAAWEEAVRRSPGNRALRERLDKARRELEVEKDFFPSDTGHFRVRFDPGARRDPRVVGEVMRLLEEAWAEVGAAFEEYPEGPIPVVLYDRGEFEEVTGTHGWVGGLYDGKIRLPVGALLERKVELRRTVFHEYAHVLVHRLAPRCPAWLNEGVAQLLEGRPEGESLEVVRRAGSGRLLSLAELPGSFAKDRDAGQARLLYAQAHAFTAHLAGVYSRHALVRWLREMGRSADVAGAFRRVTGSDLLEAERAWREGLR